eukprot:403347301
MESTDQSRENQLYLEKNNELAQLLETFSVQIRNKKPKNIPQFLMGYLIQTYGDRATVADRYIGEQYKSELAKLEQLVEQKKLQTSLASAQKTNDTDVGSENETDEDDDDDYIDVLPEQIKKAAGKGPRSSVSAEAFGAWNKKSDFSARHVEKSDDTKDAIRSRLSQSFLFNSLNEEEFKIVVDAMDQRRIQPGDNVIVQGEDGYELFVVEQGTLSCYRQFANQSQATFLKKYEAGDAFGELALLYNAPRAATITADTESLLWVLDRETFNHIVKDSSRNRREKYESFLAKVKILESMEPYERSVLSDAFVEETFKAGEYIIRTGDEGNKFYLVESGELFATKVLDNHEEAKEVMQYKAGDYFGERALIQNEPRAANVIAKTDCKLVSMDRHSFKRLMGPLDTILRRNMEVYEAYKGIDSKKGKL